MTERRTLTRVASLGLAASGMVAFGGLIGIAVSKPPYIGGDGISFWAAVFAIGTFGMLMAVPFALQALRLERHPEKTLSWEWALSIWAVVAATVLIAGFALAAASGVSGSSVAGAVGILIGVEASLVVAILGSWMLFGG